MSFNSSWSFSISVFAARVAALSAVDSVTKLPIASLASFSDARSVGNCSAVSWACSILETISFNGDVLGSRSFNVASKLLTLFLWFFNWIANSLLSSLIKNGSRAVFKALMVIM